MNIRSKTKRRKMYKEAIPQVKECKGKEQTQSGLQVGKDLYA